VVAAWGGVDVLVSNAGIQIVLPDRGVPVRRLEEDARDPPRRRVPDHQGLPAAHAEVGPRRRIIYMGSVHSKEASVLKSAYVTAKHGLIGLCKTVSRKAASTASAPT
jgi:3-hydroxybutyrate dehydrogenase